MADNYFLIRRAELNHDALFDARDEYAYGNGWNISAVIALLVGVLPNLPGFLKAAGFVPDVAPVFDALYTYAWFVGVMISAVVYAVSMSV